MYNQPYFIPGYYSTMAAPSMMRGAMGMGNAMNGALMRGAGAAGASRGLGLFGKLGSSFSALRSINWGGFINNASKTLGVINQTIPLVRQVGPMFNNMKSMLKVASVFKDETDRKSSHRKKNDFHSNSSTTSHSTTNSYPSANGYKSESRNNSSSHFSQDEVCSNEDNDSSPTFFIAS